MDYEATLRVALFVGMFVLIASWERRAPRRRLTTSKRDRWIANLAMVGLSTVLLRLVFPAAAVGLALVAQEENWGWLNQLDVPTWIAILAGIVLLDFVIYVQHVLFHAIPNLWRLHMVHHTDLDYDLTTGVRFHPVEILLSMVIKFGAIAALGQSPVAVLAFEVILNVSSMFNHGNIRLPGKIDRLLRWIIVTPDMHRVHHSIIKRETNSNYGFNLSIWDRIFGTYRAQPRDGHETMIIGLEQFREPSRLKLLQLLLLPFVGAVGRYPINRG